MNFITGIVCLGFIVLGMAYYKSIINPVSIYNLSWTICLFCSSIIISCYNGYAIDDTVYILILISTVVFSIISLLVSDRMKVAYMPWKSDDVLVVDDIQFKRILVLNIIAIGSIIPDLIQSIQLLISKGMYYARLRLLIGEGTEFILTSLFRSMFVLPTITATICISICSLIFNSSIYKYKLLMISFIGVVCYSLTVMGRWLILKTFIFMFLAFLLRLKLRGYLLSPQEKMFLRKTKRIVIVLGICLVVGLFAITNQRTYAGDVWYTIVAYFGGSLKYLDLGIEDMVANGDILYGFGLFASVWDVPLIVLQKLIGMDFLRPLEITYLYNNPVKNIGPGLPFTGFGTVIMSMYLDGRLFGVIIDSIILALIVGIVYANMKRKKNQVSISIGLYTILLLSVVTIQWDGTSLASMMTYVYIYYFYRGKNNTVLSRR